MPAVLRHFAINADNVPRAKTFCENVFGWTFSTTQDRNRVHRLQTADEGIRTKAPSRTCGGSSNYKHS